MNETFFRETEKNKKIMIGKNSLIVKLVAYFLDYLFFIGLEK